jgi:hypothetical protein
MISDAVIAEAMGGLPPGVHCSVLAEKQSMRRYGLSEERKVDSGDDR